MLIRQAKERLVSPTRSLVPYLHGFLERKSLSWVRYLLFTPARCVRSRSSPLAPLAATASGWALEDRFASRPQPRQERRLFFRRPDSGSVAEVLSEQASRAALSRSFEESKLVPFASHELYSVVADVERYQEFVPWCTGSRVVRRHGDRLLEAELRVGFRLFHEEYISLVRLDPERAVRATATTSRLFEYLVNEWRFRPGPSPHESWVDFSVDFRFRSPLYRTAVDLFFNEVAKKMVRAFEERARVVHREYDEHQRRPSSIE